jgi:hypothetical protein
MKRQTHLAAGSFLAATLVVLIGYSRPMEGSPPTEAAPVACSADTPVVDEGKSVILRAWVSPPAQAIDYSWTADAGKVTGSGHEVQWDLAGLSASPQPRQATVGVRLPSGTATCSAQVIIAEAERGVRVTGRSYLMKGKKEDPGYGLYSYLLLGPRPADSSRERYVAALKAYLTGIEDIGKLRDYVPPAKLNVTYLPVESVPPRDVTPEWLVDHYDYARAQALLKTLPGSLNEGPYIVSALQPLAFDSVPSQYLFQDLSTVPTKPDDLISWWVREFMHQAAQEHFWQPQTAESLVLKLRTTIAALAIGLPDAQKAVGEWVSWTTSTAGNTPH